MPPEIGHSHESQFILYEPNYSILYQKESYTGWMQR